MPSRDARQVVYTPSEGQPRQLAQARPDTATAVQVYSPVEQAIIKRVVICPFATSAISIFLDDDGTTYDQSTALFWDETVTVGMTRDLEVWWPMSNADGNLAVKSAATAQVTFTVFGSDVRKDR